MRLKLIKKTVIQRTDGVDYLIRYSILPWLKWPFSIKIHHIVSSDEDCLHDHPWAFLSIILKYFEQCDPEQHRKYFIGGKWGRWFGPCSILYRKANWRHRLILNKNQTVWTLVFTFYKVRDWGFWSKGRFIPWKEYDNNLCE